MFIRILIMICVFQVPETWNCLMYLCGATSMVEPSYELGMVVNMAFGILPSVRTVPAEVKLLSGQNKPAFYVLVLTAWGYVPYQLLSDRLVNSFLVKCALANVVTMSLSHAEVLTQLATLNNEVSLSREFRFYLGLQSLPRLFVTTWLRLMHCCH